MEPSHVEANPDAPLRLLSLDGGGVRGLSSLMVLDDLMETIALEEKRLGRRPQTDYTPLKPCDYFDLIGGTSTGGIIAILLSRLQLDCKECIKIYTKLAEEIFKHDKSINLFGMKLPTGTSRFSGAVLEKAIKTALVKLGKSADELMWDDSLFEERPEDKDNIWTDALHNLSESPISTRREDDITTSPPPSHIADERAAHSLDPFADPKSVTRTATWKLHPRQSVHRKPNQRGCRGFVLTTLKNALGLPRLLSTYDPNDRTTRIWEALRATSAAPTFFEEMQFGTPKVTYLDGGVGFNNPCAEVDYAAKALWGSRPIGIIVSVGTGLQSIPSVQALASWLPFGLGTDISLASALVTMATSTARVDNEMKRMYYNTPTAYYRFDVDRGLANISLEQWMKEDQMASLTEQYMRDAKQLHALSHFGTLLTRLSILPPSFSIPARHFRAGLDGKGIQDGSFAEIALDFKTGLPLGVSKTLDDVSQMQLYRAMSPSGEAGVAVDAAGKSRRVFPVAADLDHDGRREEALVYHCVRAADPCLRALRTGVPAGRYRVVFILSFHEVAEDITAPTDLVLSAGRPWDAETFLGREVDVRISEDVVPVLLRSDAVRVRVGERYEGARGSGWVEVEVGEVKVGLRGVVGLVVSRRAGDGKVVGGWGFGGCRLTPVYGERGRARRQG